MEKSRDLKLLQASCAVITSVSPSFGRMPTDSCSDAATVDNLSISDQTLAVESSGFTPADTSNRTGEATAGAAGK